MINSLRNKELIERVREMFQGELPENWKLIVSPVDYDRKDIDSMTVEWIRHRMRNLNINNFVCFVGNINKKKLFAKFEQPFLLIINFKKLL
jgi:hypothetical protein